MIKLTIAVVALAGTLAGCAVMPDKAVIDITHVSHASQHFGSDPTSYGYNALNVGVRWERRGAFIELQEGIVLNSRDTAVGPGQECYGGLWGPREVFTGTAGFAFSLK